METAPSVVDRDPHRTEFEEYILGQDRLAGLGVFTGTIIHAVNNHLGAIMGYAELLQLNPASAIFRREFEQISVACAQGIDLVRSLALVRNCLRQEGGAVDASKLCQALLTVLGRMHHSLGIKVHYEGAASATVVGVAAAFSQAMLHLLQLSFRLSAAREASDREIKVAVSDDNGGVAVTVTLPAGAFAETGGKGGSLPVLESAAFDIWVLSRVCLPPLEWRIDDQRAVATVRCAS